MSVDPIAEDYPFYTSFNYAGNKPESKSDIEGLQEEGAEPMKPVQGVGQLPDSSPGVATFALEEVVISPALPPQTEYSKTISTLDIGIELTETDAIQNVESSFQAEITMTDSQRAREVYNDIIRFASPELIGSILAMDNSYEFESKLFKDWIRYSGNRFNDHPMGALFTDFVLTFAAGGALEALTAGNGALTSTRNADKLYKFERAATLVDDAANLVDDAAKGVGKLSIRTDIVLSGGRSGQLVKNLTGPANSAIKGSQGRIFITDDAGRVIWDITKDRAKSVIPGKGFGPKVAPTQEQLNLLKQVWGN